MIYNILFAIVGVGLIAFEESLVSFDDGVDSWFFD